ncbi:alpha/beta hydrolase [Candidatus Microgenomates bacterium]|nr:alpha/beta hydrolase [Candidatus Microgenomates bacterium]
MVEAPRFTRRKFLKAMGVGIVAGVITYAGAERAKENFGGKQIETFTTGDVEVSYVKLIPEAGGNNADKAVFYLPGYPWEPYEATRLFPRQLANKFGWITFDVTARAIGEDPNSLYEKQADAIRQFLISQGIKEVTIAGDSEGAIRAANLAVSLKANNPEIKVNGIVLINPKGVYKEDAGDVARNFIRDTFQVTPKEKDPKGPQVEYIQLQFLTSLTKELGYYIVKGEFDRMADPFWGMSDVNPAFAKIEVPILFITSEKDVVSNPNKIFPESDLAKYMPRQQSDDEIIEYIVSSHKWEKMPEEVRDIFYESKQAFIEDYLRKYKITQEKIARYKARQGYLAKQLTPKSILVRTLLSSKHAGHVGLVTDRAGTTARVASRFFKG